MKRWVSTPSMVSISYPVLRSCEAEGGIRQPSGAVQPSLGRHSIPVAKQKRVVSCRVPT